MAVLGLRFCARAFSSCSKWGPLFIVVRGLSLSQPLLLRRRGSRCAGSVVVAHGPSCSAACGIFPDHGSNPCPLHWQADSQSLCHQGSPIYILKNSLFYFWLHWVFVAMYGVSLIVASGGHSSLWCAGFSLQCLIAVASLVAEHEL